MGFNSGVALSISSGLVILTFLLSFLPEHNFVVEQVGRFTEKDTVPSKAKKGSTLSNSAYSFLVKLCRCKNLSLAQESINLTDKKIIVGQTTLLIAAIILGFLCGVVYSLILVCVVWFSFIEYLKYAQSKQLNLFNSQLADALVMTVSALQSGSSFLQAMSVVSEEMPDPLAREWAITLKEMKLGVAVEQAFSRLTERVDSDDLSLMVTAILIQHQAGGNLASVLTSIKETIQDRVRLKRDVRTLTAHARTTGYIIAFLPIFVSIGLYIVNKSYIMLLVSNSIGLYLISASIILQILGFRLMKKLVNVRI